MEVTKPALLFVDDEVRILRSMAALFRGNYEVLTAASGVEALNTLAHSDIKVIVCDQHMPQMTGVETLAKARNISPRTTRILLTGFTDLNAALSSANEAGVFQYVHKPWDNQTFRRVVHQALHTPPTDAARQTLERPRKLPWSILILDDDETLEMLIRARFGRKFAVFQARALQFALDYLAIHNVAVVLADNYLRGESTMKFLTMVSQDFPKIVTLVVSDCHDEPLVTQLINQTHAFRILLKPIDPSRLIHSLEEALKILPGIENL